MRRQQDTVMKAVPVPVRWHPDLPICASKAMLQSVSPEFGWVGGMDDAGKLRCILPYVVLCKPMFRVVRFMEETIPLEGTLEIAEERAFLNDTVSYFRKAGIDMIIPGTNHAVFRTYPEGADAAPYATFVMDLTQPEETLWMNLHSKHRNVIRNAMKKGVTVCRDLEHQQNAHALVKSTLERSGEKFRDLESFNNRICALHQHVEIFVAEHEGQMQGCAVIPFSQYSAYYLYGGSIPSPLTGSLNLLQWEVMRYFRKLGVRHYDLLGARINPEPGSKQEGIRRFKERFGGHLVQGYLWKVAFRPFKRWLYSSVMHLRGGGDVVDKERHKLSQLPGSDHWEFNRNREASKALEFRQSRFFGPLDSNDKTTCFDAEQPTGS